MVYIAQYDENQTVVGFTKDGTHYPLEYKSELEQLGTIEYKTQAELDAIALESAKVTVVTMRQARLALLQSGLLATVENTIVNGTDEAMKIEWEYATEVRRDWASLIALTTALGMTSPQLDDLFLLASTL